MDYDDKVQSAKNLHERARYIRGRFINYVAVIERDLGVILTEYFCTECENKRAIFFTQVIEKLSLEQKRSTIIAIVKNDYPRFWEENKEYFKDLQKVQELRNKLAHSVLDVSENALSRPLEEGVGFVEWDKGNPITERELQDWEVRANMISSTLSSIKQLLPFKERQGKDRDMHF